MVAATTQNQLFVGSFIHCQSRDALEYLHDAAVFVDGRGRIMAVEAPCRDDGAQRAVMARLGWDPALVAVTACAPGQFFFPGFIDTHVHASQYANVGLTGRTTLLDWLTTYTFPLEASLADVAKARRVYGACVRRTLAHGTTTAAYFATIDVAATNALADECAARGQRALVGRVCMDRRAFCPPGYRDDDVATALAATRQTIAHLQPAADAAAHRGEHPLVVPILTPRFALACTPALMCGLAALAAETGLLVQTHLAETVDEVGLVAALFADADSYAGVYDAYGLLTPRTVLAHAVHLSDAELRLLAARGAAVVHCPCSNAALASGTANVRRLWAAGLRVGLGTDMSGGYSASMLDAARHACLASRNVAVALRAAGEDPVAAAATALSVDQALFLATAGGAAVLGLGDRVGRFATGLDWDAQLVGLAAVDTEGGRAAAADGPDGGNVDWFGWESWEDRVAKWMYTGDDRNTKMVWVRGRLVHQRA